MKKQHIGSRSRADIAGEGGPGLQQQSSEKHADMDRDRSVMHKMVLSTLMAFPAILASIFLTVLQLGCVPNGLIKNAVPVGTFAGPQDFVLRFRDGKLVATNSGGQGGGQN